MTCGISQEVQTRTWAQGPRSRERDRDWGGDGEGEGDDKAIGMVNEADNFGAIAE